MMLNMVASFREITLVYKSLSGINFNIIWFYCIWM